MQNKREINSKTIFVIITFAFFTFFVAILQNSFFAKISLFGVTPDIMISFCISVSILINEKIASVIGILGGIFICAMGSIAVGIGLALLPIIYCVSAYLSKTVFCRFLPNDFLSWITSVFAFLMVRSFFTICCYAFTTIDVNVLALFKTIIIPEYFCSVIFSAVGLFFAWLCGVIFNRLK